MQVREVTEAEEDRVPERPLQALEGQDEVQEDRERVEHVQGEVHEDQAKVLVVPRVLVAHVEEAAAHAHEGDTNAEPRRHEDRLPLEEQVQEGPPMMPRRRKPMTTSRGNLQVACLMTQSKS